MKNIKVVESQQLQKIGETCFDNSFSLPAKVLIGQYPAGHLYSGWRRLRAGHLSAAEEQRGSFCFSRFVS